MLLQTPERGEEGSGLDYETAGRDLFNAAGYSDSVQRGEPRMRNFRDSKYR